MWTPVIRTPQVWRPTTGRCLKRPGFFRCAPSCQMKYPSEPCSFPKQTEKLVTLRASSKESFRVSVYSAAAMLWFASRDSCACPFFVNCLRGFGMWDIMSSQALRRLRSWAAVDHAELSGTPGGPTPRMAWKSDWDSTGMSAS